MFYIYSPRGRVFSGTLEMLRKVEASSQASQGNVRQEFLFQQELEASVARAASSVEEEAEGRAPSQPYNASAESVAKYNQILKSQGHREPVHHVHQVMSRPVISVTPDFTLERVFETFEHYPYKMLPVIHHDQPVAAISRAQLYRLLLTNPAPNFRMTRLANLLNENEHQVITTDPITDVRRAAKVMFEERLEALPVVSDSGQVLGIISNTDVLRCVVNDPPLSIWA